MCKGFFDKEARRDKNSMYKLRQLCWIIVCGYADSNKLPKSAEDWWPLDKEIKPAAVKMTKRKLEVIKELVKKYAGDE